MKGSHIKKRAYKEAIFFFFIFMCMCALCKWKESIMLIHAKSLTYENFHKSLGVILTDWNGSNIVHLITMKGRELKEILSFINFVIQGQTKKCMNN